MTKKKCFFLIVPIEVEEEPLPQIQAASTSGNLGVEPIQGTSQSAPMEVENFENVAIDLTTGMKKQLTLFSFFKCIFYIFLLTKKNVFFPNIQIGSTPFILQCPLCEKKFRDVVSGVLACGHIFCIKCIDTIINNSGQCPQCTELIIPNDYRKLIYRTENDR